MVTYTGPHTAGPRFHVTIVLFNSARHIEACLEALGRQTLPPWRTTVLDNTSEDDGARIVERRFPHVHLLRVPENLGFAGGQNRAVAAAPDMANDVFILMLNPDAILKADALERLAAAFAAHPQVGILGCLALEPDGQTIQHAGIRLAGNALSRCVGQGEPDRGQYRGVRLSPSVLGAALAVRAGVWRELGGLDERFWPGYYEETDFCLRARRAGWQVAVACDAVITHLHGSFDRWRDYGFLEMFLRNRARFLVKNYSAWDWLFRYLPAEARWLMFYGSKGYRRLALRMLWEVARGKKDER
jgi:hypothetical protein